MKVLLRYAQVISIVDEPILPLFHPEEELIEAPEMVRVGWCRVEGNWVPPESEQDRRSKMQ